MPRKREKWGITRKCLVHAESDMIGKVLRMSELKGASGRRHTHEFNFIIVRVRYTCLYRVQYTRTVVRVSCISYVRCLFYWRTSTVYMYTRTCSLLVHSTRTPWIYTHVHVLVLIYDSCIGNSTDPTLARGNFYLCPTLRPGADRESDGLGGGTISHHWPIQP